MKMWKVVVFVLFAVVAIALSMQFVIWKKSETSVQEIRIKGVQVYSEYDEHNALMLDLRFQLEKPAKASASKKQMQLANKIEDIIIVSDRDIYPSNPAGSDISRFFTHQSAKRMIRSRSVVKEFEELPVKELLKRIDQQTFFNTSNHLKLRYKEKSSDPGETFVVVLLFSDGTTIVQQSEKPIMAEYY